uniref:Uncharacterized protein n=1 Tax=Timema cristinae TaxID=61476 RepID=A0A7R9GQC1_TIMCR|nr:unnamed protein product [Timema cristinae]
MMQANPHKCPVFSRQAATRTQGFATFIRNKGEHIFHCNLKMLTKAFLNLSLSLVALIRINVIYYCDLVARFKGPSLVEVVIQVLLASPIRNVDCCNALPRRTSYNKPGPPTPGKNGRHSLQESFALSNDNTTGYAENICSRVSAHN